jgi:hypothetical protein
MRRGRAREILARREEACRARFAGKFGALEKDKGGKERESLCLLVLIPSRLPRRGSSSSPPATRLRVLPAGDAGPAPPRTGRSYCSSPTTTRLLRFASSTPVTQLELLPAGDRSCCSSQSATRLLLCPDAGSAWAPPRRRSPPSADSPRFVLLRCSSSLLCFLSLCFLCSVSFPLFVTACFIYQ